MTETIPLRRVVRQISLGTPPIKGAVAHEPGEGLFPGYSASGRDVWLPKHQAPFVGPGLVVSAVGARCGKVFMAMGRWGVVANVTVLLPSTHMDPKFLWYVLNDETFWERGTTAQPYVQMDASLAKPIPKPALGEQRRIAKYLDDQVGQIDAASATCSTQEHLLEERVERVVLASVRGEDDEGFRKPSGLPWLGDVPAAWQMRSVGFEFEVLLGKMLNEAQTSGLSLKPYLRNTNVQWDRIDTNSLKVMNFPPGERARFSLRAGDLLICEGGQPGRAAIWDGHIEEVYYQKALHRARTRGRSHPRWLFYCLFAAASRNAFANGAGETTIGHLTSEQLRAYKFGFPESGEQARRIGELDRHMKVAAQLRQQLSVKRDLLKERKRALITAAVTGEFDVSSASARAMAG